MPITENRELEIALYFLVLGKYISKSVLDVEINYAKLKFS